MLKTLRNELRKPIGEFLINYIQTNKTVVLPLTGFVNCLQKEASKEDSEIRKAIIKCKDCFSEKELQEITKSVNKLIEEHKNKEKEPPKTLQERIEQQKKLLREQEKQKRTRSPTNSNIKQGMFSSQSSPKGKSTPSKIMPHKTRSSGASSSLSTYKNSKSRLTAISVTKSRGTPSQELSRLKRMNRGSVTDFTDKEKNKMCERFDPKIKPISAFCSPKASVGGIPSNLKGNMLDIINQNTFEKIIIKKKPMSPRGDIRSSEERELTKCTFKPKLVANTKIFKHIKAKIIVRQKTVSSIESTNNNLKFNNNKRPLSPDISQPLNTNITDGTCAELYNVKTPKILKNLLEHGYSFNFKEKKLFQRGMSVDSRNAQIENEIQSRILSQTRILDRPKQGKNNENSVVTVNSFMQDIILGKDRLKNLQPNLTNSDRTPKSEIKNAPKSSTNLLISENAKAVLKKFSNPELVQIKDLHTKYIAKAQKHTIQEKIVGNSQRGENE